MLVLFGDLLCINVNKLKCVEILECQVPYKIQLHNRYCLGLYIEVKKDFDHVIKELKLRGKEGIAQSMLRLKSN